jgi:hypothetical protein
MDDANGKWNRLERETEAYRAVRAHEVMLNQATAAFEHAVLSPLFLLNGGASIAFLTLLGAASSDKSTLGVETTLAFVAVAAWAVGLVAALLATVAGFFLQRANAKVQRMERQEVERLFLMKSPITAVVAAINPDDNIALERETIKRSRGWLRVFIFTSTGSFVIGTLLAAASVL